jgi:hypothetical protein
MTKKTKRVTPDPEHKPVLVELGRSLAAKLGGAEYRQGRVKVSFTPNASGNPNDLPDIIHFKIYAEDPPARKKAAAKRWEKKNAK